jgi:hypothetical protein
MKEVNQMGVDHIPCEVCGEIFADCGYCGFCEGCSSELCGSCYDEAIEKYGEEDDLLMKCQICQMDVIPSEDVLKFFYDKTGITREQAEEEIRKSNK